MFRKICKLNLNLNSCLATKMSVPLRPPRAGGRVKKSSWGWRSLSTPSKLHLTATHLPTDPDHGGHQLLQLAATDCVGRFLSCQIKPGVQFMHPDQKTFDYPLIFVQFPKPETELKSHVMSWWLLLKVFYKRSQEWILKYINNRN